MKSVINCEIMKSIHQWQAEQNIIYDNKKY